MSRLSQRTGISCEQGTMPCGMCATDVHLVEEMGYRPKLPHILGHEPVGVVAETGENVVGLKPGDRVVQQHPTHMRQVLLLLEP